jgi:type IV pilus assembly protein PilN
MLIMRQIDAQMDNNTYLKNQIASLDKQIVEIQQLELEKKQLLARMDIIQQLQQSRPQIVRLFDGLVHIVPEGLYLTSLSRVDDKILLDGKAESNTRVSTFMRNIESSGWMKSPVLSLIQADDQKDTKKVDYRPSDRMIGFNLQAIEVMDDKAKLPLDPNTTKHIFSPPVQPLINGGHKS